MLATLTHLAACAPTPAEILVHLDGNNQCLRQAVANHFPQVRLLASDSLLGPGGSRNRLTREAKYPWIAHFDDDSFPATPDFFAIAGRLIDSFPNVAVWAATITSHEPTPESGSLWLQGVYPGCGHLMSKAWFARTRGYLPLPFAYNLEEVDVSLQLHALGALCVQAADLQVWHDHPNPVRETPETEVLMMLNTLLFPLLRYPLSLFPQAALSILRRALKLAHLPGGLAVLAKAATRAPNVILNNIHYRHPLPTAHTWSWLLLRQHRLRIQ